MSIGLLQHDGTRLTVEAPAQNGAQTARLSLEQFDTSDRALYDVAFGFT